VTVLLRTAQLHEQLSQLAQSLYASESSLDVGFVRGQAGSGGATGRVASELAATVADVWAQYLLVRECADQLAAAVAARRTIEVQRLLANDAITLPSGVRSGAEDLVLSLQRQIDGATVAAARLAFGARCALAKLDAATTELAGLIARAATIGAEHDPEITTARDQLDRAAAAIATDPASEPAGDVDAPIHAVRARLEVLEQQRATLTAALSSARSRLDQIRSMMARGADALAEATAKIALPCGLLQPCDPAALAGDGPALEPWLDRIEHRASTHRWVAAVTALEHWNQLADAWCTRAEQVLLANRATLEQRSELRGLLQASQARAGAEGRAEEVDLLALGQAAEDALYVAPCDLDVANGCVRAYVAALSADAVVSR